MSDLSRRQFLEDSMFAAAAAVAASSALPAWAADEKPSSSPNERIGVACIGVNAQGNSHLNAYSNREEGKDLGTEVLYIVDADSAVGERRAKEVEAKQGRRPKVVQDLRKMLEDKSVDIVTIATPNHWHALAAIWAMQAGKDVYCEKPASHNVSEGQRMIETARKYNRICQIGTQCRSSKGSIDAIEYAKSGKIGDLKVARALCYKHDKRGPICPKGDYPVPSTVDFDIWLGPAPKRQMAERKPEEFHYHWHWFWNYGNGDLGNQGIHEMDKARWGLGVDHLAPTVLSYGGRLGFEDAAETAHTQIVILDYGNKAIVHEVRGLPTGKLKGANIGNIYEGTDGYVVLTDYTTGAAFDKNGQKVKEFKGGGNHHKNFLDACKSRKHTDLTADIHEGHLSSALCHLGNISYRLGQQVSGGEAFERAQGLKGSDNSMETFARTMSHLADNGINLSKQKMTWGAQLTLDPKTETFLGNDKANEMLTREYRAPFVVPAAGKV